jgi:formate hydrogenlyase subunit 4
MLADEVLPPEERAAILAEIQRRTGSPVSQELIDRMDRMTAG